MSAVRRIQLVPAWLLAGLLAATAAGDPARAGCLSLSVGTTAIHNCDGKVVTSQTVGTTTVHNDRRRVPDGRRHHGTQH